MHWRARYALLIATVIAFLSILTYNSFGTEAAPEQHVHRGRANATLMMLARNSDLKGVLESMEQMERRFNRQFGYPWVFLNEVPFSDEFKAGATAATNASVSFGLIPREHWFQPNWIDEERAAEGRATMARKGMPYADSISYRNMCRFNSGFFFKHELMLPYKYYWRVEPDVKYHCNMNWDPFHYMIDHNKTYSFVISLKELAPTIPSLWPTVREFMNTHKHYLPPDNSLRFVSRSKAARYNGCHFWSNFEIADMDFFRSKVYTEFFEHLDASGGFYYERWGDAPVHSIAVSLFLPKSAIHFFDRIGYTHLPFVHAPRNPRYLEEAQCDSPPHTSIDEEPFSCTKRWWKLNWPEGVPFDPTFRSVKWDEI